MIGFDQAVAKVGAALARIAASYERDPALREDLLQDILLALFTALPKLEDDNKLRSFAFRIAHNRAVDHIVRRKQVAHAVITEDVPVTAASPEGVVIANERTRRLLEAVLKLDLPYRQVMTMLLEDMSHAEIAETLAISITNVGVRVSRAKTQLKAILGE